LQLSAVNRSSTGATAPVSFMVDNINALTSNVSAFNAAGWIGQTQTFFWGLPFFYGKTVFWAIEGEQTPKGVGPYWAY
jgi:hypothetical protein